MYGYSSIDYVGVNIDDCDEDDKANVIQNGWREYEGLRYSNIILIKKTQVMEYVVGNLNAL